MPKGIVSSYYIFCWFRRSRIGTITRALQHSMPVERLLHSLRVLFPQLGATLDVDEQKHNRAGGLVEYVCVSRYGRMYHVVTRHICQSF